MTDSTPHDRDQAAARADDVDARADAALAELDAIPDDIDGHTLDGLADYLERGRSPRDPAIEASPSCQHALAALERLRAVSDAMLNEPASGDEEDAWIDSVMRRIALDARAGADFTLDTLEGGDELLMTEGALRALIRGAGDGEPGFLAGRIRFHGDLSDPTVPLRIAMDVVAAYGTAIPAGVSRLRAAVVDRLRIHTRIRDPRIDITVQDITGPAAARS